MKYSFKNRMGNPLTSLFFVVFFISILLSPVNLFGKDQPNIVLIIADDLGWNDLGCYGNPNVSTPNIDKMAKEGLIFTNAYLTTSSCSPSRASIVSGRYPHNTGFPEFTYRGALADGLITFPALLQKGGYYTAQSGKWHLGENPRDCFDYINETDIGLGGESNWISTIKGRPKDKPFFMWFAATDPHRTWSKNNFTGTHDPESIEPPPFLANDSKTRQDLAAYYDEISRFDYYVGEVEKELQIQGVLDNTIIIVISDNGRPFARCKTRLYDSGIKTPMVIKWNDEIEKKGNQCNSLISIIDLAPTLVDIAGLKVPPSFQGRSFNFLIKNPDEEFRKYIFAEHNWHGFETYERMVRTKSFMYILNMRPLLSNPPPSDAIKSPSFEDLNRIKIQGKLTSAQNDIFMVPRPFEELYNCLDDPLQLVNVASLDKYRNELELLKNVLDQWQKETGDSVPKNLTPDWYDRETGMLLESIEHNPGGIPKGIRGDKPGGDNAVKVISGGPF